MIVLALFVTALVSVAAGYGLAALLLPRPPVPRSELRDRAKRDRLLSQSMALIHQFLHPTSVDQIDFLSEISHQKAEDLLKEYEKEVP